MSLPARQAQAQPENIMALVAPSPSDPIPCFAVLQHGLALTSRIWAITSPVVPPPGLEPAVSHHPPGRQGNTTGTHGRRSSGLGPRHPQQDKASRLISVTADRRASAGAIGTTSSQKRQQNACVTVTKAA